MPVAPFAANFTVSGVEDNEIVVDLFADGASYDMGGGMPSIVITKLPTRGRIYSVRYECYDRTFVERCPVHYVAEKYEKNSNGTI